MKIRTRILAILIACTVVIGMMPVISFAGDNSKSVVSQSTIKVESILFIPGPPKKHEHPTPPAPVVKAPAKVIETSVSSTADSITLNWKKVSGAEGYEFAYKKSSSDKYSYVDVPADKTSKKITGLSSNTKYNAKVRAYKYNGFDRVYGEYGTTKTIVTKNVAPKKVTVSKATPGKAKATVSWKKVTGAKGYIVAYKKSSSKKWSTKTVSASKLSTTLSKLARHKYYYIKVKAYNYTKKNGKNVKCYGAYSTAKKIKIK